MKNNNKVGILTFHRSYNCGSMMQAFALQKIVNELGYDVEIIDFSNEGQRTLYSPFFKNNSIKNIIKNIIILPHYRRICRNNLAYLKFMRENMMLSKHEYKKLSDLSDLEYSIVIAGSDQIWNITIDDSDDAYFLPWVSNAKRIAYAPSFGARNIIEYSNNREKYASFLKRFKALSIRENNGRKWIEDLIDVDIPVVLDPTLLLSRDNYIHLFKSVKLDFPSEYIFFYSPNYDVQIIKLVKNVSKKLNMPVIAFNSKSFYVKFMSCYGFSLPKYENPSVYLKLINGASIVITTSFHGAVFSSIFRKRFWIVKNGGMLENDDRIYTMTTMLNLNDRIIPIEYDDSFDYSQEVDYSLYQEKLKMHQNESLNYLKKALNEEYEK